MSEMIDFSTYMLNSLAGFLATPPVFYLFGLVCFCFVIKAMKIIMY